MFFNQARHMCWSDSVLHSHQSLSFSHALSLSHTHTLSLSISLYKVNLFWRLPPAAGNDYSDKSISYIIHRGSSALRTIRNLCFVYSQQGTNFSTHVVNILPFSGILFPALSVSIILRASDNLTTKAEFPNFKHESRWNFLIRR